MLIIDNYDSFTYNIVQYIRILGVEPIVIKNDELSLNEIKKLDFSRIILSPGWGNPENSGVTMDVIDLYQNKVPILGVCLGMQCIAKYFGAKVVKAPEPCHGKNSRIFFDESFELFCGMKQGFSATRYHSLMVMPDNERPCTPSLIREGRDGYYPVGKTSAFDCNPPASVTLSTASRTSATSLSRAVAEPNSERPCTPSLVREVQTILKLCSLPQHPFSGRDVTLVTEREGWACSVGEASAADRNPLASVTFGTDSRTSATSLLRAVVEITAWTEDEIPMALKIKDKPIYGVQFHPEAILTENGIDIFKNFLNK